MVTYLCFALHCVAYLSAKETSSLRKIQEKTSELHFNTSKRKQQHKEYQNGYSNQQVQPSNWNMLFLFTYLIILLIFLVWINSLGCCEAYLS